MAVLACTECQYRPRGLTVLTLYGRACLDICIVYKPEAGIVIATSAIPLMPLIHLAREGDCSFDRPVNTLWGKPVRLLPRVGQIVGILIIFWFAGLRRYVDPGLTTFAQ